MEQAQTAVQQWDAIYNAPPTGDPTTWLAICDGVEAGDDARNEAAKEGLDLDDEAWARIALKAYREWLANPPFTP